MSDKLEKKGKTIFYIRDTKIIKAKIDFVYIKYMTSKDHYIDHEEVFDTKEEILNFLAEK